MKHWLMKSEEDVFSIHDLEKSQRTGWDSVRNYQARNYMRDSMQPGDLALYYHSNSEPSGVAGIMKIVEVALTDPTQFDKKSEVYDPTSTKEDPRWQMVQVEHVETFLSVIPLADLKADKALTGMLVLAKGQRLSVQPVESKHFAHICKLAGSKIK
jgi:predicted RNA-binding protein with PUA-like domain